MIGYENIFMLPGMQQHNQMPCVLFPFFVNSHVTIVPCVTFGSVLKHLPLHKKIRHWIFIEVLVECLVVKHYLSTPFLAWVFMTHLNE